MKTQQTHHYPTRLVRGPGLYDIIKLVEADQANALSYGVRRSMRRILKNNAEVQMAFARQRMGTPGYKEHEDCAKKYQKYHDRISAKQ